MIDKLIVFTLMVFKITKQVIRFLLYTVIFYYCLLFNYEYIEYLGIGIFAGLMILAAVQSVFFGDPEATWIKDRT